MTLYIDADGCPVVNLAIRIAGECGVACVLICDTAHVFERPGARTITVPQGADSVDFVLVNLLHPGDVVVTQDYGLAAMCLARRAVPIHQDGMVYTAENIDALLFRRHIARKIRAAGGRAKGPRRRAAGDDETFGQALRRVLGAGREG